MATIIAFSIAGGLTSTARLDFYSLDQLQHELFIPIVRNCLSNSTSLLGLFQVFDA